MAGDKLLMGMPHTPLTELVPYHKIMYVSDNFICAHGFVRGKAHT